MRYGEVGFRMKARWWGNEILRTSTKWSGRVYSNIKCTQSFIQHLWNICVSSYVYTFEDISCRIVVIVENRRQAECPFNERYLNKIWNIHILECVLPWKDSPDILQMKRTNCRIMYIIWSCFYILYYTTNQKKKPIYLHKGFLQGEKNMWNDTIDC